MSGVHDHAISAQLTAYWSDRRHRSFGDHWPYPGHWIHWIHWLYRFTICLRASDNLTLADFFLCCMHHVTYQLPCKYGSHDSIAESPLNVNRMPSTGITGSTGYTGETGYTGATGETGPFCFPLDATVALQVSHHL